MSDIPKSCSISTCWGDCISTSDALLLMALLECTFCTYHYLWTLQIWESSTEGYVKFVCLLPKFVTSMNNVSHFLLKYMYLKLLGIGTIAGFSLEFTIYKPPKIFSKLGLLLLIIWLHLLYGQLANIALFRVPQLNRLGRAVHVAVSAHLDLVL